jgi:hypothetical protein
LKSAQEAGAVGKCQRVADDDPLHGDDSHHDEVLHQHAENVFRADQPAVEQEHARNGHEQYQRRRRQHPGGVARINFRWRGPILREHR